MEDVTLIIALYVDDMPLIGLNKMHIDDFKVDLNLSFQMSNLGLLHRYLDIQFKECDGDKSNFENCKPIIAPI